jgi:hypothetical protein
VEDVWYKLSLIVIKGCNQQPYVYNESWQVARIHTIHLFIKGPKKMPIMMEAVLTRDTCVDDDCKEHHFLLLLLVSLVKATYPIHQRIV